MPTERVPLSDLSPEQENARVAKIKSLGLATTETSLFLEEQVQSAKVMTRSKFAAITILTDKDQWIKVADGLAPGKTARDLAFCNHTILRPEGVPFIVEDAKAHLAFNEHPSVVKAPFIRSYLGLPLITSDGHALGALCVMDTKPRTFSDEQMDEFRHLARLIVQNFEGR